MPAPVTTLYAAVFGLLLLALSALVVRARWRFRVGLGTGGDVGMERAVRVQANFTEYVPLALVLLLLAELAATPPVALHAAGTSLVACRLLHAWGLSLSSGRSFGRFWGTAGTWLVLLALSGWLLLRAVSELLL